MADEITAQSSIVKGIDVADIHVDTPLSNLSTAFMQDQSEYIASKWFPIVNVSQISGNYFKYALRSRRPDADVAIRHRQRIRQCLRRAAARGGDGALDDDRRRSCVPRARSRGDDEVATSDVGAGAACAADGT